MNTIEGLTVDPPPFHAMKEYPYAPALTWQHLRREDWDAWHTRYLDTQAFREHLRPRWPDTNPERATTHIPAPRTPPTGHGTSRRAGPGP